MEKFEDNDIQNDLESQEEVEINLFAEEVFDDGKEAQAPQGEISVDFGEAADSMLADIKSDSLYGLEPNKLGDEDFDPGEVASETVVNVEDPAADEARGQLTESADLDELQDAIDFGSVTDTAQYEIDDEEDEELKAYKSRRRLRRLLIFFIIVLLLLAGITGLFIWRNSTPPDVKKSDFDALQTSDVGTNTTKFDNIAADRVPNLISFFGKTPEQVAQESEGKITLDAASAPSTDAALPNVASTRSAWFAGDNGQTLANITFGMNADGAIDYIFASFDLDAYGVADAKFDELSKSYVVAGSILKGIGLSDDAVKAAVLTVTQKPEALISNNTSGQETARFTGSTNIEGVPSQWTVTETYDHTAGVTIGDNSVIRTLSVDLR